MPMYKKTAGLLAFLLSACLLLPACQSGPPTGSGEPETGSGSSAPAVSGPFQTGAADSTLPDGSPAPDSSSPGSAPQTPEPGHTEATTLRPAGPGTAAAGGQTAPPVSTGVPAPSQTPGTTAPPASKTYPKPDAQGRPTEFILSTFMAFDGSLGLDKNRTIVRNTRDAGLNLIEVTWLSTEESILAALKAADVEGGIGLLVQNARGVGDSGTNLGGIGGEYAPKSLSENAVAAWIAKTRDYKSLYGYYVWDEPTSAKFSDCAALSGYYKKLAPDKMVFSCIYPSYGNYRWPSAYPRYVDDFLHTVRPTVLSMDYYPFQFQSSIAAASDLWRDLGYLRKRSLETGTPQWHYFQAIQDNKSLSVEQIRVQMNAALAYGVKGLSYYTSQNCLTTAAGGKTANYDRLSALNRQTRNIGDLLFDKQNAALYQTGLSAGYNGTYYLDSLASSPFVAGAPDNLIIGVFTGGGKTCLAVTNKNHAAPVSGTLSLKKSGAVSQFLPDSGTTRALPAGSAIPLHLEAGGIAVYILG